jgi:hypothetical protein
MSHLRSTRGSVSMEFLLMLPFVWLILMLTFAVGSRTLARHRGLVAVREVGVRQLAMNAANASPSEETLAEIQRTTLTPRRVTGQLRFEPAGEAGSGLERLPIVGSFLAGLTGAGRAGFEGSSPPVSRFLPSGPDRAGFYAGAGTWTHDEAPGGLLGALVRQMGGSNDLAKIFDF